MEIKHYYFRTFANLPHKVDPVVTVALIKDGDICTRGIAICCPFETPNKKEGRQKAKERAKKALETKENSMPINRYEAIMSMQSTYAVKYSTFLEMENLRIILN